MKRQTPFPCGGPAVRALFLAALAACGAALASAGDLVGNPSANEPRPFAEPCIEGCAREEPIGWPLLHYGDDYSVAGAGLGISDDEQGRVAMWVRPDGTEGQSLLSYTPNMHKRTQLGLTAYSSGEGGRFIQLIGWDSPDDGFVTGSVPIPNGAWTLIEAQCDGSSWRVFVNGVEDVALTPGHDGNTGAWFADSHEEGSHLYLGAHFAYDTMYGAFRGAIGPTAISDDYAGGAQLGASLPVPASGAVSHAWPHLPGTGYASADAIGACDLQLGGTPGEDSNTPSWGDPYTDIGRSGPVACSPTPWAPTLTGDWAGPNLQSILSTWFSWLFPRPAWATPRLKTRYVVYDAADRDGVDARWPEIGVALGVGATMLYGASGDTVEVIGHPFTGPQYAEIVRALGSLVRDTDADSLRAVPVEWN